MKLKITMHLIEYYNLSIKERQSFYEFLKDASTEEDQPAHSNMWDLKWETKTNTLPYILTHTDRFKKNGSFYVLFDNSVVVACSGAYTSNFSNDVALLGVRTWIHRNYRHKLISREYLLPAQKAWAITTNHKIAALTFNDYNKNIIKIWNRKRLGEIRSVREPRHFGYDNVHIVDFPVNIQYTKQWVIYEKLDSNFTFDWDDIKWE
jgi:hypothetical protein